MHSCTAKRIFRSRFAPSILAERRRYTARRNSMHSSRGSCTLKHIDAIADETTAGLTFEYPSSYCGEQRSVTEQTTQLFRVSQATRAGFLNELRLKIENRSAVLCEKKVVHTRFIHDSPQRSTRETFFPAKIIFAFIQDS